MDRFLARKSASGSAAQPALTPSSTSAEQPVVQFACLKDVRLWLATPEVLNGSLDVSALKEAVTVLSRVPKPRKEEVQPLLSKWGVAQKDKGKLRPLADVIRELEQKVVNAAHQLANSVPASAAQPATSSSEQRYKKPSGNMQLPETVLHSLSPEKTTRPWLENVAQSMVLLQ